MIPKGSCESANVTAQCSHPQPVVPEVPEAVGSAADHRRLSGRTFPVGIIPMQAGRPEGRPAAITGLARSVSPTLQ